MAGRIKDANVRFAQGQTEGKVGPVKNIKFLNCKAKSENGIFVSGEYGPEASAITTAGARGELFPKHIWPHWNRFRPPAERSVGAPKCGGAGAA